LQAGQRTFSGDGLEARASSQHHGERVLPIFIGRGAPIHASARCGDFAVPVPGCRYPPCGGRFGAQLIGSLTHLTSPTPPRPEWVRPVLSQARRAKVAEHALLALADLVSEPPDSKSTSSRAMNPNHP